MAHRDRVPILLLIILTLRAPAVTIRVPADQPTIALGLAAATAGDTVLVACGDWNEHGLLIGEGVTLRSETGAEDCAQLNGQALGRILRGSDLSEATRIEGFTFKWGRVEVEGEYGGAILLERAHPLIRNCAFENNLATWGGAVAALKSRAVFEDCRFESNRGINHGGAIWCDSIAPVRFTRCEFTGNDSDLGGGAIACYGVSHITLEDCRFRGNESSRGGAIRAITSSPEIRGTSFVDNVATEYGGAVAVEGGDTQVIQCTLVRNSAALGSALDYRSHEGGLIAVPNLNCCVIAFNRGGAAISCEPGDAFAWDSDIFGNPSGDWTGCMTPLLGKWGNISEDPQFCSHADFINLDLQSDSPCVVANCESAMGAFPVACGDQATESLDWGRLKSRY